MPLKMIRFGLFKQCSKRMTCEVFVSSCTGDTKWKSIFAFLPFLPRSVVISINRLSLSRHPRCSSLPPVIRYHYLINPLASVSRFCRKVCQCYQHRRTLGCRHGLSNRAHAGSVGSQVLEVLYTLLKAQFYLRISPALL